MHLRQSLTGILDNFRRYGLAAAAHDIGCRAAEKIVDFHILKGMSVQIGRAHV